MTAEVFTADNEVEITLVDAPERGLGFPENQRTYSLLRNGTRAAVRVRRNPEAHYLYVVENLVGGKWHHLLDGDVDGREVPFDAGAKRAAAVLYAPKKEG